MSIPSVVTDWLTDSQQVGSAYRREIGYNSVNFEAMTSRFRMVVNIVPLNFFCQKTKWPPKTEWSITQAIFKLEAPDFHGSS